MPIKITMPALSPTMTEGTLAKWVKNEGDDISPGDVIAEIETDKATMEVEAVEEGKLAKIIISAGTENVPVNEMIAVMLEEDEDDSALQDFLNQSTNDDAPSKEPKAEDAEKGHGRTKQAPEASSSQNNNSQNQSSNNSSRIVASPLAKRIASQNNVNLSQVNGSGPQGRVVKADVEKAMTSGSAHRSTTSSAPMAQGADARALADAYGMEYETVKNSGMRKIIAKRLLESKQTVPHFYLTVECQLDGLLDARKSINAEADGEYKLSVNDFVIKAVAEALQKYPAANVAWTEDAILQFKHSDVSIAVATESGLITPIIKKAEEKSLREISTEMKELAGKARDGKLKPEEFQGGTFSISNLGMFGVDEFSAIINPPQSCILAVGAGKEKPYAKNGAVAIGTFMNVTLSTDHRSVDGAVGAEFLKVFKRLIENPILMMT